VTVSRVSWPPSPITVYQVDPSLRIYPNEALPIIEILLVYWLFMSILPVHSYNIRDLSLPAEYYYPLTYYIKIAELELQEFVI